MSASFLSNYTTRALARCTAVCTEHAGHQVECFPHDFHDSIGLISYSASAARNRSTMRASRLLVSAPEAHHSPRARASATRLGWKIRLSEPPCRPDSSHSSVRNTSLSVRSQPSASASSESMGSALASRPVVATQARGQADRQMTAGTHAWIGVGFSPICRSPLQLALARSSRRDTRPLLPAQASPPPARASSAHAPWRRQPRSRPQQPRSVRPW